MRKLKLREGTNTAVLFGHHDQHLKLIEEGLGVRLSARGEELTLDGLPEAGSSGGTDTPRTCIPHT